MKKLGTGNKASIAFPVSGFVGAFTMIGGTELEVGDQDVSDLESDEYQEFEPEDLIALSDIAFECFLDTEMSFQAAAPTSPYLQVKQKELVTITFQTRDGESTPASFAAWCYLKKVGLPQHVNNEVQKLTGTLKVCNRDDSGEQVKPTWTPAVPTV